MSPVKSRLVRIDGVGEVALGMSTRRGSRPHYHDGYTIGIFSSPVTVACRGSMRQILPGELIIIEPGEVHGGKGNAGTSTQDGMVVDPRLLSATFGRPVPVCFPDPVVRDDAIVRELTAALRACDGEALRGVVVRLFRRHGQACEIEDGSAHQAPPGNCPADFALSRYQYRRRTIEATGLSPRDYQRLLRVTRAKALIERGLGLAEAAADAGFADQPHMNRQFRQLLGVTPGALTRP